MKETVTIYAALSSLRNNLSVALNPDKLLNPKIASMEMQWLPAGTKSGNKYTLQPTVVAPNFWTIEKQVWFGFIPVDFVFSTDPSALSRSMTEKESKEDLLSQLTESWERLYLPELGDTLVAYPYEPTEELLSKYQQSGSVLYEPGLIVGTPVLRYILRPGGELIPFNPETRHAEFLGLGKMKK